MNAERKPPRKSRTSGSGRPPRRKAASKTAGAGPLVSSEQKYQLIFQHTPIAIFHFDPSGIVTECNERAAFIIGAPRSKIIGIDLLRSLSDPRMLEAVRRALGGEQSGFEGPYVSTVGGKHAYLKGVFEPIRAESGAVQCCIGMFEDFSERRRMEAELERSERLLQTIIDAEPECVKIVGPDGKLVMINPAGLAMLQAETMEQLNAQPDCAFVVPGYCDAFRALAANVFRGGSGSLEFEAVGLKGRRLWLETYAAPLRNEHNEIIALLGVTRDITERKRSEEVLKAVLARHETLIQAIPDMVFFKDRDGRYQVVNRAMERSMSRSASDIIGKTDEDISPPDVAAACRQSDQAAIDHGGPLSVEEFFAGADGRLRYVESVKAPIFGSGNAFAGLVSITRDITERKRSEMQLKESEQRFRTLFEGTPDAEILADIETGAVIDANPAACRLLGKSWEQIVGMHQAELHPPRIHEAMKNAFAEHIEESVGGGVTNPLESAIIRADGAEVPVEIVSRKLVMKGKTVMYGTFRDISRRKRVEDDLRESRDLLSKAEEIAKLGSWEWEIATGRLAWSEQVYRLYDIAFGSSPDYAVVLGTLHPDYRAGFERAIDDALNHGKPFDIEYGLVRPDGSTRITHSKGEVIRDDAGKPVKMVGIVQDITEQKQAEAMVRNILETVDEAFIIIDRNYRILSANRAYAVQAGREQGQIVGMPCHEVSHGIFRPCYESGEECAVRSVFETGMPATAVHTHYDSKKNPIYVETKAFPMKDASGRVAAAIEIVNNVTEKKRLEEQLRHAQKMEAIGLLAGGIAHDFNNILTAIIGYGNLLNMKLGADNPLRTYAEQVLAAAARAANLTQSLLAFSRKQMIHPRPCNVNEIIGKLEKLLRRIIGEDVELRTEAAPRPLTIMADPGQIEQVLMNLATNARDAMAGGGALTIRTESAAINDAFRKKHGFGRPGIYARTTVTDTGMGIDEQILPRIFEPFFTTKEMGRGTGLGLAIVYGIVKQNGGFVTVESEPGKGSTFSLYFPQVQAATALATGPAAASPEHARGSGTILLAEDDATLRTLLTSILTQFGYTVIEAADGDEAVERFREHQEDVELLVLDVIMPKRNGKEARDGIRRLQPGIKTLFISGYSDTIFDEDSKDHERSRFLSKPVTPSDLLQAVHDLMAKS